MGLALVGQCDQMDWLAVAVMIVADFSFAIRSIMRDMILLHWNLINLKVSTGIIFLMQ